MSLSELPCLDSAHGLLPPVHGRLPFVIADPVKSVAAGSAVILSPHRS